MQLLVSVADAAEARAALSGGADVIDAKDPRRGTLGAVPPARLAAIRRAVGWRRPVSAALGDDESPGAIEGAARMAADLGVAVVKVGFRGVAGTSVARPIATAARRGAGDRTRLVLVAYGDWRRAGSLAPERLVALAADSGASGVLLDTAHKGTGLFQLLAPAAVSDWIAAAHAAGLFAGLAGSLTGADFAAAHRCGADLVGVRGAACVGGRAGRVSRQRVADLAALARTPAAAAVLV